MDGVGRAGLGRENNGHKFLVRFEALGIADSKSRGFIVRMDGAVE